MFAPVRPVSITLADICSGSSAAPLGSSLEPARVAKSIKKANQNRKPALRPSWEMALLTHLRPGAADFAGSLRLDVCVSDDATVLFELLFDVSAEIRPALLERIETQHREL